MIFHNLCRRVIATNEFLELKLDQSMNFMSVKDLWSSVPMCNPPKKGKMFEIIKWHFHHYLVYALASNLEIPEWDRQKDNFLFLCPQRSNHSSFLNGFCDIWEQRLIQTYVIR